MIAHTNVTSLIVSFEAAEAAYAAAAEVAYAAAEAGRPEPASDVMKAAVARAREALSGLLTARVATDDERALRVQVLAKIVAEDVYEDFHAPLAMAAALDLASQREFRRAA